MAQTKTDPKGEKTPTKERARITTRTAVIWTMGPFAVLCILAFMAVMVSHGLSRASEPEMTGYIGLGLIALATTALGIILITRLVTKEPDQ